MCRFGIVGEVPTVGLEMTGRVGLVAWEYIRIGGF